MGLWEAGGEVTRPCALNDAVESPEPLTSEASALLALSARAPKLELSTLDLCFLATLYLRGQASGELADQLVAGRMAERVVDHLEAVEIEEQQGDPPFRGAPEHRSLPERRRG